MTAPAKASQGSTQAAAQAVPDLTDVVDGEESQPAPAKPARKPRQKTPRPSNSGGGSSGTSSRRKRPQTRSQNAGGGMSPSRATPAIVTGDAGESVAGVLLAAFFWGWVALPFLSGGVDGVKNMLRAKFLNKAPDGTYLP